MSNPFEILGLNWGAGAEEAKRAYRRLVMQWHPDRNSSPEAEETFKRIKAAFELVSDPLRFAEWQAEQAANSTASEERTAPPQDDEADTDATQDQAGPDISLSLEEGAFGCEKDVAVESEVACSVCEGSGEEEYGRSQPCRHCKGIGRLRDPKGTTVLCTHCVGRGFTSKDTCRRCSGSGLETRVQTFRVRVPAGVREGDRVRLAAKSGALLLRVRLQPHRLFELRERDLICRMPVSLFRLMAGGRLRVPTLSGEAELELKTWPTHGLEYGLKGQGYPGKGGGKAGDLHVHLEPVQPEVTGAEGARLLEELERLLQEHVEDWAPALAEFQRRCALQAG